MKKCVLLLMAIVASLLSFAQITWDGEGDGLSWNDAANWFPDGVPSGTDDVILDNSIVSGSYTVNLPTGNVTVSVQSLIIDPATGSITLLLPPGNTANPGLQITGTGNALIINSGAILRNASGAASGGGLSIAGVFRINNGGRYIHNTARSNASIVSQLSTATGTETGIFEYDVPVSSYTPSFSGRTYGTLVLSATTNAATVTYVGAGAMPLTVRNDLQINTMVTLSLSMSAAFNILGNFYQASSSVFNLQNSTNSNGVRIAGNISAAGTITETGTGLPALILNGTARQQIAVAGTIQNNVDLQLNNSEGAVLTSSLVLPYRYTIVSGNLMLDNFDFTTPVINQVSAATQTTNHIITNGTGVLIIPAVTAAIFPVGPDEEHYNPVVIDNGGNAQFRIRVDTGINPSLGIPFPAVVNRTWYIHAFPDPGAAAMLRYGFYDSDWLSGFNTAAAIDLGKYNNGWNVVRSGLGVVTSASHPPHEVSFTNMVSGYNGAFIIGNAAFGLPINFSITTRGEKRNNTAEISWAVNDTTGISSFEIQRSVNGRGFATIGIVLPAANSLRYKYTDNGLVNGTMLYRVKADHRNAATRYSNTVAVLNTHDVLISAIVPNPVRERATVYINAGMSGISEWLLVDINGRILKKWRKNIAMGNSLMDVSLGNIPSGIYQLIGYMGGVKLDPLRIVKL